jgi:uncharacterized membrane protein
MPGNRSRIVSVLLLVTAVVYGIIPPLVDFTETHAFHPQWPPHARFHMVWLLGTNSALAAIVAWLVLKRDPQGRVARLRMASLLGVAAFAGFVFATLLQSAYGGALHDPAGGVPPLLGYDANLALFTPAILAQLVAVWLAHRGPE